jgi:hypothetical protein
MTLVFLDIFLKDKLVFPPMSTGKGCDHESINPKNEFGMKKYIHREK